MLDKAFEALKTYDWGQDAKVLNPIDEAIVTTHGDEAARRELENQLAALLKIDAPLDAKQMVCRYLRTIGTATSVPTLAALLSDEKLSHMGRYALERIPAPEAAAALRDALPKLSGNLKIGVISSLGVRGDEASVQALGELLDNEDAAIARAAAFALGDVRTPAADKMLSQPDLPAAVTSAVTDSLFACAEKLLADGKNTEALAIYKGYAGEKQPKHVRLAATRGMLACAGKKE